MQTILIIEDETSLLELYADLISSEGYKVLKAADGEEGLKLAMTSEWDLMLLDIMLPKLDGLEILIKLKKSKILDSSKKVIVLSNLDTENVVTECLKNGALEHLAKSAVTPQAVVAVVEKYLPRA